MAVCLAALLAAGWHPAAAPAGTRLTDCGHLTHTTVAIAARGIGCAGARRVGRAYLDGVRRPWRFRCVRHTVSAANGWWASCARGRAYVEIAPE